MRSICWPALVLACILLSLVPPIAAGDAGSDYLDFMEQQVERMASRAEIYFHSNQRCDNSCDMVSSAKQFHAGTNVHVDEYRVRLATNKTSWRNESLHFDLFTLRYSRVIWQEPKMRRFNDKDLQMCKCKISGMMVGPLMKDIVSLNQSRTRSRPFFGSIDGTWRAFPVSTGRPQHSFVHQDLEQFDGNISLVTKSVFGEILLGVVGIDIFIDLTDVVNQALQSKIINYSVPMAPVILSATNCTTVDKTLGAFSNHMVWLATNAYGGITDSCLASNGGSNRCQINLTCTIAGPTYSNIGRVECPRRIKIIKMNLTFSNLYKLAGHVNFKKWTIVMGTIICLVILIQIGFIFLRCFRKQTFCKVYVNQEWPSYYNELKDIDGNSAKNVDYYKLAIDSIALVQNMVEEANVGPLQLNDGQCKVVVQELGKVGDFLLAISNQCISDQNGRSALQHLYYAIKKASLLIEKCSCKTSESWIVMAMTLVDIQECFVAIILDLQQWRMILDIVITSASTACHYKRKEVLMIMDEEYQELYKKLHRSNNDIQQAALGDKKNIILKLKKLRELENDLEYPYVIHLLTWFGQFEDDAQKIDSNNQARLTKFDDPTTLGRGGCGTVFQVTWLGLRCALKILNVKDEREATALKNLSHPNIVRLYHYWEAPFENPKSHLIMELMAMDLGVYIERLVNKASSSTCENVNTMPFLLHVAIDIMLQVAQAMQYLHERHLAHRDLKTTNILVKQMCRDVTNFSGENYLEIKLADFGLAKTYDNTSSDNRHTMKTGTLVYGAPEIFGRNVDAQRNFPPMADVWSFGVTCAEILSGKKPYMGEVRKTLQSRIANENLRPTLPKCCPPYLAFCISSCWEFQPQRRPNFASISKMLRHAKLLSLNLTNVDDSKMFLGYTTHRNCVKGFSSSS